MSYREFSDLVKRLDAVTDKLDAEKADGKDVDALHAIVRDLADEVRGLRRVLIGFMVAITLAAVGYATSTYRLANATQQTREQTK